MDLAPLIGAIGGGITLTGALILALVRYLTNDGAYRDTIAELRRDNDALRRRIDDAEADFRRRMVESEEREEQLLLQIRRLHVMIADDGGQQ